MIQGSVQACSESPAMGGPSLSPHQSSAHPRSPELGADILSRKGIAQGEWRLHPESVRMIWTAMGEWRWICSLRARMRIARCSSTCLTPR